MLDRPARLDRLDQRILGGFRVVDQLTGRTIRHGLKVKAPGLSLFRTPTGIWAVTGAEGMAAYARAFDPVPAQAAREFTLTITDTLRRYDPIEVPITLPRNAAPDAAPADRVDRPVEIAMPSSPGRGTEAGWSTVTVEVMTPGELPVIGALVQVLDAGTANERGWALTGLRGQAVVPLTGIAHMQDITVPDDGGITDDDDDPDIATITAITALDIAVTAEASQPWPARPVVLRSGDAALRTAASAAPITLQAGGAAHARITLTLT